jgi:hypothetical protein
MHIVAKRDSELVTERFSVSRLFNEGLQVSGIMLSIEMLEVGGRQAMSKDVELCIESFKVCVSI